MLNGGAHLSLMIGPAMPIPAPKIVIDSLKSVQVNHDKDRYGFQLTFSVGKNSSLLNTMLPAGYFDPMITRVIIIVTLNGFPHVLMDGLVTRQELAPSNEVGQTVLTITGEDLSIAMDVIEEIISYPAFPEKIIISTVLARYAVLGIVPLIIPPIYSVISNPTFKWKTHPRMTDRAYIKYLAQRCGYIFFIRPGPIPGRSIAYFGPDTNLPWPQPALNINMDAHSNVESLSFSLDGLAKKVRIDTVIEPISKAPVTVPIPNVNAFKPPLGLRLTPPAKVEYAKDISKLQSNEAAQSILAFLMNNANAISANGSLDVLRYGHILHSRMLVGVRGAGLAYDGMYYVDSVKHDIKPGEYKQNFSLTRDGLISNTPRVLP